MQKLSITGRLFSFILAIGFVAGITPFVFNAMIDPYEVNPALGLDLPKGEISEKAHYPLWKMAHYPEDGASLIVLGDSRARALRDKHWHKLGVSGAYNHAYGGGTIPEIYETFKLIKNDPALKTLVVGIQLRSFDPKHKDGLNRVPEAIALHDNPLRYYSSWFVSKVSWRVFAKNYPQTADRLANLDQVFFSSAKAEGPKLSARPALSELLSPEVCLGCELPEATPMVPTVVLGMSKGPNLGLGRGSGAFVGLWPATSFERELPKAFASQVTRSGRAQWRSFEFSNEYWGFIEEIASWTKANDVQLIFVIPATIAELQETAFQFGLGNQNQNFRTELAKLAPVFDFDFPNTVTADLTNFKDAYHFNSRIAGEIVGEIAAFTQSDENVRKQALKRRGDVICPVFQDDIADQVSDRSVRMREGMNCRIWEVTTNE